MSGLVIYGDLTAMLPSADSLAINFVGEGVKLLAPGAFRRLSRKATDWRCSRR